MGEASATFFNILQQVHEYTLYLDQLVISCIDSLKVISCEL